MAEDLDIQELLLELNRYFQEFQKLSVDLESATSDCVYELYSIADDVDKFHMGATITNVVGSTVGLLGGITTIVGIALAPVTLGASLMVSGVGIAAATAGGVTGVSASIADSVNTKKKCEIVKEKIKKINDMILAVKTLESNISTIAIQIIHTVKATSEMKGDGLEFARMGGKGIFVAVEIGRLAQLSRISAAAARGVELAGQGARAMRAVSGAFAALFVVIDAVFLVKGALELHRGAKTERAAEIREKAYTILMEWHKMRENSQKLTAEISSFISDLRRT